MHPSLSSSIRSSTLLALLPLAGLILDPPSGLCGPLPLLGKGLLNLGEVRFLDPIGLGHLPVEIHPVVILLLYHGVELGTVLHGNGIDIPDFNKAIISLSDRTGVLRVKAFDIVEAPECRELAESLRQHLLGMPLAEIDTKAIREVPCSGGGLCGRTVADIIEEYQILFVEFLNR